jgi:hypothetical protein
MPVTTMDKVNSKEIGTSHVHDEVFTKKPAMTSESGRWWNWRLVANRTSFTLRIWLPLIHSSLTLWSYQVVIVGLAMGLFGYDNAFASPLVSLPLFVERYQGPGFQGALVFTVRLSRHVERKRHHSPY